MTSFKIHDIVSTVYGTGYVADIRGNDYIVKLTHWQLAQGQSPTLYLQAAALTLIPGCLPGVTVSTQFGHAKMIQVRGVDGVHIAKPINWKLANDTNATLFLQSDMVKLAFTPDFKEGDEVMTFMGQGRVILHDTQNPNGIVVLLNDWKLAQGQSPTLHLNKQSVVKIPGLRKGQVAKTVWGLVRILDIRRDGTHVCTSLPLWTLADKSTPLLYLAPEAFALLSLKP